MKKRTQKTTSTSLASLPLEWEDAVNAIKSTKRNGIKSTGAIWTHRLTLMDLSEKDIREETKDVREEIDERFIGRVMEKALLTLNEIERYVLNGLYYNDMTYRSIGKNLYLSGQRIGQIHTRALRKLRQKEPVELLALYQELEESETIFR